MRGKVNMPKVIKAMARDTISRTKPKENAKVRMCNCTLAVFL